MKRAACVVAVLAAGCSMIEPSREPVPSEPSPGPGATSPAPEPAPVPPLASSNARTLDEYKAEVAHAILHANASSTFIGKLPEILKSVVVLQITIDRNGFPFQVRMFRSNGYQDLEARAIQSVRAAALPKPTGSVTGGSGTVTFTETWLFRDDGKFQIRTLAGPQ